MRESTLKFLDKPDRVISEEMIALVAINPVKGFRRDENVTSFRSFLVELDDGGIVEQKRYIEQMNMPYSICIFSGNKSLHYGIVLENDLPDYNTWKYINKWVLNIMQRADQQTLNPTRSIRFPNHMRKDDKQRKQALVFCGKRIKNEDLYIWLNKFPEQKPQPVKKNVPKSPNFGINRYDKIPRWVKNKLLTGILSERNNTWFSIGCALGKVGYDDDEAITVLEPYFTEDEDFDIQEWESAIKSGVMRTLNE